MQDAQRAMDHSEKQEGGAGGHTEKHVLQSDLPVMPVAHDRDLAG